MAEKRLRPARRVLALQLTGAAATIGIGIWRAPHGDWDMPLFGVLLAFSIFSDLTATAVSTRSRLKISGSFLALVLAMVFLGGTPAALIGVLTIVAGWWRWRDEWPHFLNNTLTYATFPLVGGVAFNEAVTRLDVSSQDAAFYLLVFGVFLLALLINFTMVASFVCHMEKSSFSEKIRSALIPLLPSELAAALMAAGVAFIYMEVGLAAIALFGIVLPAFQYLPGHLLLSEQRAEELERGGKQLASFQVGMLSAMLRT